MIRTLAEFLDGLVEVEFVLEIDGFEGVFYGGTPPTLSSGHLGANRTAVPGLQVPEDIYQVIEDARAGGVGTVESDDVAITILPGDALSGTAAQLVDDFLRVGPEGSDTFATLATTLEQDAAALTIVVNEDISGWIAPLTVWVGQEATRIQSITAPSTLNVAAGGRGYLGTQIQRHRADSTNGWAPRVHTNCVVWEGRPARLLAINRRLDGSLAPGSLHLVNGYMRVDPNEGPDGLIEVILAAWPQRLNGLKVGGDDAATGLQHGFHIFDGNKNVLVGDGLLVGFDVGEAFSVRTDGTATAAGSAVVQGVAWEAHADVFDPSQTDDRDRRGLVRIDGHDGAREVASAGAYGGDARGGTLTLSDPLGGAGIIANTRPLIRNAESEQYYRFHIATLGSPSLVEWPAAGVALVNAAWQEGSTQGADGLFADIRLELDNPDAGGAALSIRMNSQHHTGEPRLVINYPGGPRSMAYGIDLAAPDARVPIPVEQQAFRARNIWGARRAPLQSRRDRGTPRDVVPIRGVATAFWDQESDLVVEDDVFSAAPFYVEAVWTDHAGEERRTRPKITGKATVDSRFPGRPGVILTVDEWSQPRALPFGDWPGTARVVIREVVRWENVTPPIIILQLIASGTGNGTNGPDDVIPYGAGIDQAHIDRESFLGFPVPGGIAGLWTLSITEETDVLELIGKALVALSAVLTTRLNQATGERRLALVSTGTPVWTDSVDTITAGDWLDAGPPASETRRDLINSVHFTPADGQVIRVNNQDSRGEYKRTAVLELELDGVHVPAGSEVDRKAAVAPIAGDIFAARAYHRRKLKGVIPWHRAILLDEGVTATVSADFARDPKGRRKIEAKAMRVLSRRRQPDSNHCEVEFEWADANTSGYAPSLRFASRVDADNILVEANHYTAADHPVTGEAQQDIGYFAVGDAVEVIEDGNFGARVTATITAISGLQVTIIGHGLFDGDQAAIDPTVFDNASTAHKRYTFLADDSGKLGASNVDAFVYA